MKKTKKFLLENKKEIHDLLNHMWRTIEKIHVRMEDILPDIPDEPVEVKDKSKVKKELEDLKKELDIDD